jgi:hypothetical protein
MFASGSLPVPFVRVLCGNESSAFMFSQINAFGTAGFRAESSVSGSSKPRQTD